MGSSDEAKSDWSMRQQLEFYAKKNPIAGAIVWVLQCANTVMCTVLIYRVGRDEIGLSTRLVEREPTAFYFFFAYNILFSYIMYAVQRACRWVWNTFLMLEQRDRERENEIIQLRQSAVVCSTIFLVHYTTSSHIQNM